MSLRPSEYRGVVRDRLDEIKSIQTLLADVYKDRGDGGTLLRELVQNADDARADRLEFIVLNQGLLGARNPLLRGPALLVVNNGPFSAEDDEALHKAIGGSKEVDTTKIGTFGVGLKSVFHICEAFVYVGKSSAIAGVVNPWAGTGNQGEDDPVNPDWDRIEEGGLEKAAAGLLDGIDDGLLLWIPLRRKDHLNRGTGLGGRFPTTDEICAWFGRSTSIALLLAQCNHVRCVKARHAANVERLGDRTAMIELCRPRSDDVWIGRYKDDSLPSERCFRGTIETSKQLETESTHVNQWLVWGAEVVGSQSLRKLQSSKDWPSIPQWRNGRYRAVPRKALAHVGVTILRPDVEVVQGVRVRWAAFLPLNDDPDPKPSAAVDCIGDSPAWEVVLHGYFWPEQDRRTIPGVTDQETPDAMRVRWNQAVRDEVLPLLPCLFERVVAHENQGRAYDLLKKVAGTPIVRNNASAVRRDHWLLPEITADGVRWFARSAAELRFLSLPGWTTSPPDMRKSVFASWGAGANDAIVVDHDAPRLACEPSEWPVDLVKRLLNCVPRTVFGSLPHLRWTTKLVCHVVAARDDADIARSAAVAGWLASEIAAGVLAKASGGGRLDELRDEWRRLCSALPDAWLVRVPLESHAALAALAADGAFGAGLFPAPFQNEEERHGSPDSERLERALRLLGTQLAKPDLSTRGKHSRLRLADALLPFIDSTACESLREQPLIRAVRLPSGQEDAWSMDELEQKIGKQRVFSRTATDAGEIRGGETDHRRATSELAQALGEDIWLVTKEVIPSVADVPFAAPEVLAKAVCAASNFRRPGVREPLVKRLLAAFDNLLGERPRAEGYSYLRNAIRALLVGRAAVDVGQDEVIYYAQGQDDRRTLGILLRLSGRPWATVQTELVKLVALRPDVAEALAIVPADAQAFTRHMSTEHWRGLQGDEALYLVQQLRGRTHEEHECWRALPIHRCIDGSRITVDGRTYRLPSQRAPTVPPPLMAELEVLDPEREVAHLYASIATLDRNNLLGLMLRDLRPEQYSASIVDTVRPNGRGEVDLPNDSELRVALRKRPWLPLRADGGVAPDNLLVAPDNLLSTIAPLGRACVFGKFHLPQDVDADFWERSETVVRTVIGSLSRVRQAKRIVDAIQSVSGVANDMYTIAPTAALVDADFVSDALRTALVDGHQGWKLVSVFAEFLKVDEKDVRSQDRREPLDAERILTELAKKLCGTVPAQYQVTMLKSLSDAKPAKESAGGRAFAKLLTACAKANASFAHVLPKIDLPTQDGNWHSAKDVARSESGVARRHRVIPELRPCLRLDVEWPEARPVEELDQDHTPSDVLQSYFESWRGKVRHGAVGQFLCLLGAGRYGVVEELARHWLGEDNSLRALRHGLQPDGDPCSKVSVRIAADLVRGRRVTTMNLLGGRVEMEAEETDTLFAVDPRPLGFELLDSGENPTLWEITLRDVEPKKQSERKLLQLLCNTAERWAVRQLGLDREVVRAWWSEHAESSRFDVEPARAAILADLPLTLQHLGVTECMPLKDALTDVRQERSRARQLASKEADGAWKAERQALNQLAHRIEEHRDFLWHRVQKQMRLYGYSVESVLLELVQNADDALAQAVEISKGRDLPARARRLVIEVSDQDASSNLDITHYGRQINDTGGPAFPAGKTRDWDQDLYFMMLMNLSGKPGETFGQGADSTTGRFGLGFKSVHLLSPCPSVASGFIAFSIVGGLLPVEQPVPEEGELPEVDGHKGTRVRLPLRQDEDGDDLLKRVFRRFDYARALLPAFARQVQEVDVRGGPSPGSHAFIGKPVNGAPGWSMGGEAELPNHRGRWTILRFKPADAGRPELGTLALAVGIHEGMPTCFDDEMPFLWNVAPTSESWACGYAINGPFKLDPGRTHVSLEHEETSRAVDALGQTLGKGLIDLYDSYANRAHCQEFMLSLWKVLATGLDNPDTQRGRLLWRLHGSGRGLSEWMSVRRVVPSGLRPPFAATLPALAPDMRVEVATDGLDEESWGVALADVAEHDESMTSLLEGRHVVSGRIASLLHPLLNPADSGETTTQQNLTPQRLLAELAECWDHRLTPARLQALRSLVRMKLLWYDAPLAGRSRLVALSADGEYQPLRLLLLPRGC